VRGGRVRGENEGTSGRGAWRERCEFGGKDRGNEKWVVRWCVEVGWIDPGAGQREGWGREKEGG